MAPKNDARVPRAQLAVTILSDPDYCWLMQQRDGPAAFGVWTALLIVARDQSSGGRLRGHRDGIAGLVQVTRKRLDSALRLLTEMSDVCQSDPWIVDQDGTLVIRNYRQYHDVDGRGGSRSGAGRPRKNNQKDIQSVIKNPASVSVSVPTSVPASVEEQDISSGDWHPWARYASEVLREYPRSRIGLRGEATRAVATALAAIWIRQGQQAPPAGADAAVAYLTAKTQAYATAVAGAQLEFTPQASRWYAGEGYAGDEAEWRSAGRDRKSAISIADVRARKAETTKEPIQ